MKETIIYAPSCNKTELLRSLARFGKNTIGIRIVDSMGLIERAFLESGNLECIDISTAEDCILSIYNYLNSDKSPEYFKAAKTYDDAKAIYSSLNIIRVQSLNAYQVIFEQLEKNEKNKALLKLMSECKIYDLISYIKEIINDKKYENLKISSADILTLEDYHLNVLEQSLLNKFSEKKYSTKKILSYFDKIHFAKAYGNGAETEWIISTILKNGYNFDDCVVAYTDSSYSELFYTLSKVHNIPMTFASGISIKNSNPGKLLKLIQEWSGFGYYGIEPFKKIINSPSFDKEKFKKDITIEDDYKLSVVVKAASSLRLSFDEKLNHERVSAWKELEENKRFDISRDDKNYDLYTSAVEKIAEILNGGIVKFLGYSKTHGGENERAALSLIANKLQSFNEKGIGLTNDIYESILSNNIMQSLSKEGFLHVVPIEKANSSLRNNVFICGLTASYFPGKPQEDPLFSDEEIKKIAGKDVESHSNKIIKAKNNLLEDIINIALESSTKIYLSYPYYDTADLKTQNPSSKFFELSSGREIEEIGYFSSGITPGLYSLGNDEKVVVNSENKEDKVEQSTLVLKEFDKTNYLSPTAIESFVECPRRFYLQYVEKIPYESLDDTNQTIPANSFGTIIHDLMEDVVKEGEDFSVDELVAKAKDRATKFFIKRVPLLDSEKEREIEDIVSDALRTYKLHNDNKGIECVAMEKELKCDYQVGDFECKLEGHVDRIDKLEDGTFKIIDYKTGRSVKPDPSSPATFIQALLYAYMYEKENEGKQVSICEFWYPKANKVVSLAYEDGKKDLKTIMSALATSIEKKSYARNKSKDNCKYCNYKDICKWPDDLDTNEGDNND